MTSRAFEEYRRKYQGEHHSVAAERSSSRHDEYLKSLRDEVPRECEYLQSEHIRSSINNRPRKRVRIDEHRPNKYEFQAISDDSDSEDMSFQFRYKQSNDTSPVVNLRHGNRSRRVEVSPDGKQIVSETIDRGNSNEIESISEMYYNDKKNERSMIRDMNNELYKYRYDDKDKHRNVNANLISKQMDLQHDDNLNSMKYDLYNKMLDKYDSYTNTELHKAIELEKLRQSKLRFNDERIMNYRGRIKLDNEKRAIKYRRHLETIFEDFDLVIPDSYSFTNIGCSELTSLSHKAHNRGYIGSYLVSGVKNINTKTGTVTYLDNNKYKLQMFTNDCVLTYDNPAPFLYIVHLYHFYRPENTEKDYCCCNNCIIQ